MGYYIMTKPNSKIKVECVECGKKFTTTKMLPTCPKCGGSDIEVR